MNKKKNEKKWGQNLHLRGDACILVDLGKQHQVHQVVDFVRFPFYHKLPPSCLSCRVPLLIPLSISPVHLVGKNKILVIPSQMILIPLFGNYYLSPKHFSGSPGKTIIAAPNMVKLGFFRKFQDFFVIGYLFLEFFS